MNNGSDNANQTGMDTAFNEQWYHILCGTPCLVQGIIPDCYQSFASPPSYFHTVFLRGSRVFAHADAVTACSPFLAEDMGRCSSIVSQQYSSHPSLSEPLDIFLCLVSVDPAVCLGLLSLF